MTLSLIADSYFALRYKESSDLIEFNALELFAQESWTQQAFDKTNSQYLQMAAISIIFLQTFMTLIGTVNGYRFQALFLSFYLARMMQFFVTSIKGIQMYQSNLVCVMFALMSCGNLLSFNSATIQSIVMLADAYLGAFLFVVSKNV